MSPSVERVIVIANIAVAGRVEPSRGCAEEARRRDVSGARDDLEKGFDDVGERREVGLLAIPFVPVSEEEHVVYALERVRERETVLNERRPVRGRQMAFKVPHLNHVDFRLVNKLGDARVREGRVMNGVINDLEDTVPPSVGAQAHIRARGANEPDDARPVDLHQVALPDVEIIIIGLAEVRGLGIARQLSGRQLKARDRHEGF